MKDLWAKLTAVDKIGMVAADYNLDNNYKEMDETVYATNAVFTEASISAAKLHQEITDLQAQLVAARANPANANAALDNSLSQDSPPSHIITSDTVSACTTASLVTQMESIEKFLGQVHSNSSRRGRHSRGYRSSGNS